jgi:hypothetical protein
MISAIKILRIALLAFAIPGLIMICSCSGTGKKAQEKMMEKALEQGSGENTDVDIQGDKVKIESGDQKAEINLSGKGWPEGIPDDVPEFKYGSINHTTSSEENGIKGWGVFYKEVKLDALDKYDAELKKNGFETMKMAMPKGGTITAEKGKIIVTAMISEEISQVGVQVRE